jgi:hypothetical protein
VSSGTFKHPPITQCADEDLVPSALARVAWPRRAFIDYLPLLEIAADLSTSTTVNRQMHAD